MTEDERQRLRNIKRFDQLIAFLRDELDWPIEQGYDEDDLTFDWSDDLGLKESERVGIKEIKQLRPLETGQPWGIFFVNFEKKQLPIVILRRILNALVMKKRASANKAQRAAWQQHDLLFISSYGEDDDRQLTFAHFSEPDSELDDTKATLRVLGWDDEDTNLKLDYVADKLKESLTWPSNPGDLPAWRKRWSQAFELRHRQVIDTAEELALRLAELAKRIRNRMLLVLPRESESGDLRKLLKGFKTALIHDLDEKQFADMYAQTITYGLFSAAVSRTVPGAGTAVVQGNVVDMIPATNPFLKEMLSSFLKAGGHRGKLDFDELGIQEVVDLLNDPKTRLDAVLRDFGNRTRGEDPVIHFYEGFAKKYDPIDKVKRGEFYTPLPVVSCIVRSAHELLQTEFNLADGLADTSTWGEMLKKHPDFELPPLTDEPGEQRMISLDEPFVQILDPATGTGTFLVEVIDVIFRTMTGKWRKQGLDEEARKNAWNSYVPKNLLPRLYAYELKMAPYAIAHMKIGLKLSETGYRFGADERVRVFLTNALEPWQKQLQLPEFEALAHEAAAVNEVKRCKRFTVVIGNPPYSLMSANLGATQRRLVDAYRFVDGVRIKERGALQLEKNLQDDYVKFIRFSQKACDLVSACVLGMVTNHSYIENPTLRGLRRSLTQSFSTLTVLDLHGNTKKKEVCPIPEKDKNVFDIQQGVAICLFARWGGVDGPAKVKWSEMWGSREKKYSFLEANSLHHLPGTPVRPSAPLFLFVAQDDVLKAEFENGLPLDKIFKLYSTGIATARDRLSVQFTKTEIRAVLEEFLILDPEEARKHFALGPDTNDWKIALAQTDARQGIDREKKFLPYLYRPFDHRFTYYTGKPRGFHCNPRRPVMQQLLAEGNIALCAAKSVEGGRDFAHVFVTKMLSDHHCVSLKEVNYVLPLFFRELETESEDKTRALWRTDDRAHNFCEAFTQLICERLGYRVSELSTEDSNLIDPAECFGFIYAITFSDAYRKRYADFLKKEFARIPIPSNRDLFNNLAKLGNELVNLHLLDSPRLDERVTEFIGANGVVKIGYSGGTVWIDAGGTKHNPTPGTSGFRGVPQDVWNFQIGGYQVCEKWLKDRKGRVLSDADIAHYHKIVVALSETIRLMAEIDRVIDEHGGWPDAFQTKATT